MRNTTVGAKFPFQKVECPACGQLLMQNRSPRPYRSEVRHMDDEEKYDIVTRCRRCNTWVGAYMIPKNKPAYNTPGKKQNQI